MSGDYCEGDSCGGDMAEACATNSGLYVWVLLTTGITATTVLIDLVKRYVLKKEEAAPVAINGTRDSFNKGNQEIITEVKATLTRLESIENGRKAQLKSEVAERAKIVEAARRAQVAAERSAEQMVRTQVETTQYASQSMSSSGRSSAGGVTDTIKNLINSVFDSLRNGVNYFYEGDDLPDATKEQMTTIAKLEEPCNTLSGEFDRCAVAMVKSMLQEQEEEEAPESEQADPKQQPDSTLDTYQKRRFAMRSQWSSIRRIFYCIDVHLKNASYYHQYFYECEEMQQFLNDYNATMTSKLELEVTGVQNLEELRTYQEYIQSVANQMQLWEDNISRLAEDSRYVVPVNKRTEPLDEPTPARVLCDYKDKSISVSEGESVILTDNTDSYQWKIELTSGKDGSLPAVVCLIPPPDTEAVKRLAKLKQGIREAYVISKINYQRKLLIVARDTLSDILKNKLKCMAVIHPEHKVEMLADLSSIHATFSKVYSEDEDWPPVEDMLDELKKIIEEAPEEGEEAECLKEVMESLRILASLADGYEQLLQTLESHKTLQMGGFSEDAVDGEGWDTLEELEQHKRQMSLGVNVRRESTQIGETSTYESASGESRSTFSIKSVIDPRDSSEMSINDAIRRGIISQERGVYINPVTHEQIPIPIAMSKGLIKVESTKTSKTRELKKAVGVVKVQYTRETRPYSVKAIMDPRSDKELSIVEAIEEGVFDQERERWCNPDTGEEMTVENAIDCGGFIVEYDDEAEVTEPEVSEKTFAVFGVLDRKAGKRLPFYEAVEKGLIDKEEGIYYDTSTGENMHVVEAFKRNYVRGRVIEDPKQLDYYLSKTMSGSQESLTSEGSIGS